MQTVTFSIMPSPPFRLDLTALALRRKPVNIIDTHHGAFTISIGAYFRRPEDDSRRPLPAPCVSGCGHFHYGPPRESRHHEEEKPLNRQEYFRRAEGDSLRALICKPAVRFPVGFQIAAISLEASSISHEQKQS
jgi:hypothetical protein